ncbi:thiamine pyrophosphate-binding protein [Variovorax paradoxus]|uniref:thiamine pyrophosphate-binding protein n=1 Tax=Variovorax paradoxus TaxID=34073 RepID=UPI00399B5607
MALQINGAQALCACFSRAQVREVFGIVGGKLGPLLNAVAQQEQLRFVEVRHEGTEPMMAAAAHAAPGRIAVALGEMGRGGLNMASGLGVDLNNNLPLQCTSVCLAF